MTTNKKLANFEDRKVDLTSLDDRDFIDRQKNENIADRDKSSQEAKESERALCGQLMLVTTVLLTANVFIVTNSGLLRSLNNIQKLIMLLGMSVLSGSIHAGVKYYFVLMKYYTPHK